MKNTRNYYDYVNEKKKYLIGILDEQTRDRLAICSSKFIIDEPDDDKGLSIIADELIEIIQEPTDNEALDRWLKKILEPYNVRLNDRALPDVKNIIVDEEEKRITVFLIASVNYDKYASLENTKIVFGEEFDKWKKKWEKLYKWRNITFELRQSSGSAEDQDDLNRDIQNADIILVWIKDSIGEESRKEIRFARNSKEHRNKKIFFYRIIESKEDEVTFNIEQKSRLRDEIHDVMGSPENPNYLGEIYAIELDRKNRDEWGDVFREIKEVIQKHIDACMKELSE